MYTVQDFSLNVVFKYSFSPLANSNTSFKQLLYMYIEVFYYYYYCYNYYYYY